MLNPLARADPVLHAGLAALAGFEEPAPHDALAGFDEPAPHDALAGFEEPAPHDALAGFDEPAPRDALAAVAAFDEPAPIALNVLERVAVLALREMDRRNGVNRDLAGTDREILTSINLDSLIEFVVRENALDMLVERDILVAFLLDIQ
jgi:hypothetical protein